MAEKNSFILHLKYGSIFAEMSDKQAGVLIKAIFNYIATGKTMEGLNDVEVKTAFKFIKLDLDYNNAKYTELCEKRAAWGRKGGKPKKAEAEAFTESISLQDKHKPPYALNESISKHNDVVVDVDNDVDKLQLLTAADAAGQAEKSPKPKKLNNLQEFSNRVIAEFEDLQTQNQISVWFKRNCRNLSDILKFCGGDIDIGLECIAVCVERLEKAGLKGGYEAVCRNLPDYYREACQRVKARVKNAQENN
ncbi:DUF6291 domain-containing protein [Candidatus Proelusimicrobium excrementi]|mgnify:CR=1 FL=1|uniref:DUF6291 domain-containing protein n=1 Tax=Candidatus Proelusimicrobium excrementi TaxID=3416222 RepID=UPI003D0DB81D